MKKKLAIVFLTASLLVIAGWGGSHLYQGMQSPVGAGVPITSVKRGDVTFRVTALGNIQGGKSRILVAPMTGSREISLTSLKRPGELVEKDEVIAQFDTTEETYKLREAEADLAEAELQVKQSELETKAREEELNYELIKARADVKVAEIECTRNPLLPLLTAKQNDITLESARERLEKLLRDYPSRKAAAAASITIQLAARDKSRMLAATAKRNIDMMTLRAPMAGYVNVERNQNSNFFYQGMQLPLLQVGDAVRPGMPVVQIPDLSSWEASAQVPEEDRGHIAVGQSATIELVALPGKQLTGKVTSLGGTVGSPWNRRFECKLSVEGASKDTRPGMTAKIVVETHTARDVLWIPAQALFESDGRKFVYLRGASGFTVKDVTMIRRGESRVVVEGLRESDVIAMANPIERQAPAKKSDGGPMKAISK